MPVVKPIITANNCTIEFAGQQIGRVQSLTIDVNYNLQEVKNLYQNNIQGFAKGITSIGVTAKKALIDIDSFFGNQTILKDLNSRLTQVYDSIPDSVELFGAGSLLRSNPFDNGKDIASTILGAGSLVIPGFKSVYNTLQDIKYGVGTIMDFFAKVPFDIIVKAPITPSVDPTKITLSNFITTTETLWKISGCKINSKHLTLDIGNIIIMEDISILANQFVEPAFAKFK